MRKLSDFFKRSSSTPQRGRSQEQRPSSSTNAARLYDLRAPTRTASSPTLLSAGHSSEALQARLHSSAHEALAPSTPALVQTPSLVSALPAHSPFSRRLSSHPTSSLHVSDASLSSNTFGATPVTTKTFASASLSSRPSTACSMATSTRSAPPRIRIDRNASPARPETLNNVAPFISDPTLLAPKPTDSSILPPPPVHSRECAGGRKIPGGMGRSYVPSGIGRNFLPGTGYVGTGSGMGMGPGMGLTGIAPSSRSRPGSAGSSSIREQERRERRERRQSTRRSASVSSALVDASEPGPFDRPGKNGSRAR